MAVGILAAFLWLCPRPAVADPPPDAGDSDPYEETAAPQSSLELTFAYARKLIASGEPFTLFIHQPAPGSGGRPQVVLLVGPAATQPGLAGLPGQRRPQKKRSTSPVAKSGSAVQKPTSVPPKRATDSPATKPDTTPASTETEEPDSSDRAAPPAGPQKNADSPASEQPSKPATSTAQPVRNILGVSLGGGILTRTFGYTASAANSANLRSYSLPAMPLFEVSLEAFPAASTGIAGVRDLGMAMDYAHSVDMESVTADGTSFNTHAHRWNLGLRYRWLLGSHERTSLGVDAQYGQQQFAFAPQNALAEAIAIQTPSVDYQLLRLAGRGAYRYRRLQLGGGCAYLGVLDGGEIYKQFRSPTMHGIALSLHGKVALTESFALSIKADYQRLFSSFNPEPGDEFVAGGALDQYFYTRAVASYNY